MLYNKYQPKEFTSLLGNHEIFSALEKYRKEGNFPQKLLFSGIKGVGKSTCASIVAESIPNCYVDLADGGVENGVARSRDIASKIKEIPLGYKNKLILLEEAHRSSNAFFDALLVVTNAPPPNVYFIICTTELGKIPTTIKSRFVKYNFQAPNREEMITYLDAICEKENIETKTKVLRAICVKNSNVPRDCLSDLELIMNISVDKQLQTLEGYAEDKGTVGYEIAQLLKYEGKSTQAKVSKILKEVSESEVEGIRRVVLNFHKKVFLSGVSESAMVLESFQHEFPSPAVIGLVLACYENC